MIKRIILLLLAAIMTLSLCACGNQYKPVPSTDEEARTVLKAGKYEVPYELFRTFFLTEKEAIDGGDASIWIGDKAEKSRQAAIDEIIPKICDIYAMFSVCEAYGVDINSAEINDAVSEYVKMSIEGGAIGDSTVLGFEDYDAYLEYLRGMYMNDSVSRLLIRYSICEEVAREKFIEEYKYTEEDVSEFFASDECARITWLRRLYEYSSYFTPEYERELADKAHAKMTEATDFDGIIRALVQYSSSTSTSDIENGFYIGKYTLDEEYMREVIDAAFTLSAGEFSPVIENYYGLYIVYAMEKEEGYLDSEAGYEEICEIYLNNQFYRALEEHKKALLASVSYTDFFGSLNFAEIEY